MKLIKKIYGICNSPSGTTLASMIARSGNTLFLLPFISKIFPIEYFNIWMLLAVVYSLKDLLDLGLVTNFARLFSYAHGGITNLKCLDGEKMEYPNEELISKIYYVARKVYFYIAIFAFIIILFLGSFALWRPFISIHNSIVWYSWGIVVIAIPLAIYGNIYSSLLLGIGKIAFVKKWDTIFNILSLLSSFLILFYTHSFLLLVLSFYVFNILIVVRNYVFIFRLKLIAPVETLFDHEIWSITKNLAGKNFIAGLSSFGIQRGVEILIGNFANVNLSSSYLFSSRLLEQLKSVSAIFFFPKIQIFASKYIQESKNKLLNCIRKDMLLSSTMLLCGIIFLFLGGWKILKLFGLNVNFISNDIWIWMGLAALLERNVSMFAETFAILTNQIISHIGLIISGIIFLLLTYFLLPQLGIKAIPIAFFISYISFYMEFAIYKLKSVQIKNSFLLFPTYPIIALGLFYCIYTL